MSDKGKSIIIKKIKKGHGGHHGGAWKVAYADFVTAMMAFFLLMWLLAMVSPEKKAALSQYFEHFSLFSQTGQSLMSQSSQIFQESGGEVKTSTAEPGKGAGELSAEDLQQKLKKAIEDKLAKLKDQALVDIFEGGVRIQLVDMEGKSMFLAGSAQMSPTAKEIVKLLVENIKDLPNPIAVEGHTDAAPVKSSKLSNWELSTDRASSARRELEANGIAASRIARVVGYADTELLLKDNPTDPKNRRISIILLQQKAPKLSVQPSQPAGQRPIPSTQQGGSIQEQQAQERPMPPPAPAEKQRSPALPAQKDAVKKPEGVITPIVPISPTAPNLDR